MAKILQAVRGMNDVLPDQAHVWDFFEQTVHDCMTAFGYRAIRMPVVEQTDLFVRSIGEVTDIVEKEMYTFTDHLNGESLTLRPEGTASCVRAVLEHNLLYNGPQRLYYSGPMFRHERPQKGRYRQFHQVGIEALGYTGPDIDVELILICAALWKKLGLTGLRLEVGTLGDAAARTAHRSRLIAYLEQHADTLDEDARRRLYTNPLRVLDSKNPAMQAVIAGAPQLLDYLDDMSRTHFEEFQSMLRREGIDFTVNPRLVRGLDYYNRTVFEWVTDSLGAQGTVCAGGRYDGLVEQMGGKPAPACGLAMGVERLLALMENQGTEVASPRSDLYIVHQGERAESFSWQVARELRDAGFSVILHCGGGGFKTQMKKADASGACLAVIVGDDEAQAGEVSIKSLRTASAQVKVGLSEAAGVLKGMTDSGQC